METIGRYVIEAELGRGGFGKVYRAFDPVVGRPVAIKVLTVQDDDDQSIRFRNEAAASGRLVHKNIVTVHDFGQEDNHPYLVMELVEGKDLSRILKEETELDLGTKLDIIYQVTEGLQAAHRNGIVHRDIKPANIMILPNGLVKILDFGIARWTESAGTRLTRPGYLIGSIHYMSPEQFQGLEVDERSDIFSLGVVAYQLFTGKHPFWSENQAAVIYNVTQVDPAPLTELKPDLPPDLDRAILLALQKDRELRYPSVEDLRLDLQPLLFEVKREEAEGMLAQAEEDLEKGDAEQALTVLRQVLRLDPNHARARKLRRQAEGVATRKRREARTGKLVEEGRELLAERRFDDAGHKFREALALDPENKELEGLLKECRERAVLARRSRRGFERAKQLLAQGDVAGADAALREAMAGDPDLTGARPVREQVEQLLQEHQRKLHLEETYAQAKAHVEENRFDAARRSIAELREQSFNPATIKALEAGLAAKEAAWQRREKLEEDKDRARKLLREGAYAEAVREIEELQRTNPKDGDLPKLLDEGRRKLAAQRREEAIMGLKGSVAELIEGERFATALVHIERVRDEHGEDADLERLRRQVQSARETSERRAALRKAREDAERAAGQGRFDEALGTLDQCARDAGPDAGLDQLRAEIEKRRNDHLRELAVAQIAQRNRKRIDSRQFAEAIAELESGEAAGFGDMRLVALLEEAKQGLAQDRKARYSNEQAERAVAQAEAEDFAAAQATLEDARRRDHEPETLSRAVAEVAKRKSQAISRIAAKGRAALDAGELEAAARDLQDAVSKFSEERSLRALLDEARLALEKRRLDQQAERAIARARDLVAEGSFREAHKLIERTVREVVDTPALRQTLDEIRSAEKAHTREKEIEAAVADCRALLSGGKLDDAALAASAALKQLGPDPRLADVQETIRQAADQARRDAAIADTLGAAESLLSAGKTAEALRRLEAHPREIQDARIDQLLRTVRERYAQEVHAKAVADCAAEADRLLASRQPERALELLTAKAELVDAPEIQGRLERARTEAAAARRQREIHEALDKATALDKEGREDEALQALEAVLKEYSDDEALLGKRAEVRASRDRKLKEQAVQEALQESSKLEAVGRFGDALECVHRCLARYPAESRLLQVQSRLESAREQLGVLQQARGLIKHEDFDGAIQLLEPALKKFPKAAELRDALAEAKRLLGERERKAFVEDIVKRSTAFADQERFGEAIKLLDEGLGKEPSSEDLQQARTRVAERQQEHERNQLVIGILEEAEASLAREALEEALESVEAGLEVAPGDSRLIECKERVTRALDDRRRAKAVADVTGRGKRLLSLDKLDEAHKLLAEANQQYPGSPEIEQMLADCEGRRKARDREQGISKALSESGGLAKLERYDTAISKIESAESEYQGDERLEQRRRELLDAKREADRKKRIVMAHETARRQASQSQFDAALATLGNALAVDSGEESLLALKSEVEELKRNAALREAFADLDLIERRLASESLRPRALRKLGAEVDAVRERLPGEAELSERCRDTRRRIDEALAEAKKAPAFPLGKAAAGVGVAAAIAVGAFLFWPSGGPGGGAVPLALAISPAGSTVTLGDQTCVLPACELSAPVGEHTLRVEKPGYAPVTTALTVPEGQSDPVPVNVTLEALPSVLELVTDLASGRVFLDDRPAESLEEGRWSLLDLEPGHHTLRVESGRTKARIELDTTAGALPAIPGGAEVEEAQLLGVSRLGGEGRAFSTGSGAPATLDDKSIGAVGPEGLQLDGLKEGQAHTLAVGQGDDRRRVIFDVFDAPAVSLYLFSDRSVGSVVVRTGQPGVRVQIGDRSYETNRDGSVRALLDVGSYSVRASKPGFQAPSAKSVEIQKGLEQQLDLQLLPVNPVLSVRGGEPGAQLVVDGEVKGVLDGSGYGTAAVGVGAHEIEIRKEGFRTQRLSRSLQPAQTLVLEGSDVQLARIPPPPPPPEPAQPKPSPEDVRREAEQRQAEQTRQAQSARFEAARQANDVSALRAIAGEANNPFASQASDLIRGMAEQQGRTALASGNAQQIQAHLDRFPDSPLAVQLRQKLGELQGVQQAAQDRAAVRKVIEDYSRAYKSKDLAAMTSLHVGLTSAQRQALEQTFSFARALEMTFEILEEPQVRGASATAPALQTAKLTDDRGRERSTVTPVTIALEKSDAGWKIRSINPR